MNKLISLVKKEKSIYLLAVVAEACENSGILNTDVYSYKSIIDKYLATLINDKAKTPTNTMNSIIRHQNGKKYFDLSNNQEITLLDKTDLSLLKQEVISKLDSKQSRKLTKFKNLKPIAVSPIKYDHIAQLEKKYPDVWNFVRDELEPALELHKYVCVNSPEKSGKKIIKQILAIRGQAMGNRIFNVISSLNRKDCKSQRDEYLGYGIDYLLFDNKKSSEEHVEKIKTLLDNGKSVTHMHDEADFGTGVKQIITPLYLLNNKEQKFVGFSASNEELALSNLSPHIITYVPPFNYCGAKWYINNNLVFEAQPFFDESSEDYLSEQGKSIIDKFSNSDKRFLVIRLASGFSDYVKFNTVTLLNSINKEHNNVLTRIEPVDQKNSWDWGENGHWRRFDHGNSKTLVIICQTATRSVEFCKPFLRKLYALHDYRTENSSFAAKRQAMMRPAHFKEGPEDDEIKPFIYGCYQTIKLAANLEDCKDFDKRIEFCDNYNGSLGIRITNNHKNYEKFMYHEMIFGHKPSDKDIEEKCNLENIYSIFGSYSPKYRNIGQTPSDDLAQAILNGTARSTNYKGGIPCYHIDKASSKFPNSFYKLQKRGYLVGQYVVLVPFCKKNSFDDKSNHNTTDKSLYQNLN